MSACVLARMCACECECLRARERACALASAHAGLWAGVHLRGHTCGIPASIMQWQNARGQNSSQGESTYFHEHHIPHAARAKSLAAGHLQSLLEGV